MFFNTKILLEAEGDEVVNIDDEAEEATDYNEGVDDEVADDTTEEETADDTEDTTEDDTTEDESTDEDAEEETEEPTDDEPTDYTEDVDTGETEDTDADASTDDSQGDSSYGSESENTDDPNVNKNKALMKDFIELYDNIDNNMNKLDKIKSLDMITTEVINRVKYNLTNLSDYVYEYIRTTFTTKDYTDNLYTYKYVVQLYKICVQMLTKINDFGENT